MYLGIDLGTSGVKVVLMASAGHIVGSESVALTVSRPHPQWSEQAPQDWWKATCDAMIALKQRFDLSLVKAIGFSGQMHGATLLDSAGAVLRPAILWNDGRCMEECALLEKEVPTSRTITGNVMMPGFTAPKLKWLQRHEPECFASIAKVLLPKDYLRYCMTGQYATDMSDASGTMWLNVKERQWSETMLEATGLTLEQMPVLFEGNDITGYLLPEVAESWGMSLVPVSAGGGDNAAGAIGVGITQPGQAMLSLGTSGVYFAVNETYAANPEGGLHSFCHAVPNTWHAMSVILSAASCLSWVTQLTQFDSVPSLLEAIERDAHLPSDVIFLPYLSGERTPHNDPDAKGVFFGMTHSTSPSLLGRAVLEGVGFAFADALDSVHVTGNVPSTIALIGGGAKSPYWSQMLANILNRTLDYREGGDVGPALGAARLAQLAMEPETPIQDLCPVPELICQYQPDSALIPYYIDKRQTFQALYQQLKHLF